MLEGTKYYIYLIIDQENKGVLGYAYSASVANAVAKGTMNSSVMLVPIANFDKSIIENYNNNFKNNYKLVKKINSIFSNSQMMTSEGNVCESSKSLPENKSFDLHPLSVSELWSKKRKLTAFKINKLKILETICDRYLSRLKTFTGDTFFFQYIGKALDTCDMKSKSFSPAIIEWGEINNISDIEAYYDLKMQYESAGIAVVRINAVWNKYSDMINSITNKQDFEELDIFSRAETEVRFGEK
jgi:hypothetical protein